MWKLLFSFSSVQARLMFDGEMASLEMIAAMDTVKVPEPIKVHRLDVTQCWEDEKVEREQGGW